MSGQEETGMDRTRFEQLLPDFIENNLSGRELTDFNSWLEAHAEAREEVGALRELILDVSDIEVPDPGHVFWTRFLPDLRTRMETRTEKLGIAERLRRVLLRPAIISSFALATVILVLLVLFSNMGPRGEEVMAARRVNQHLEAALRGSEDSTLAALEEYFNQANTVANSGMPMLSGGLTLSAADSENGGEAWLGTWLDREEQRHAAVDGEETCRLLGGLDTEESNRLQELLQTEMATG